MLTDALLHWCWSALFPSIQPTKQLQWICVSVQVSKSRPHSVFAQRQLATVLATAHFRKFGSLDHTGVRGRWKSTSTARLNNNEGIATLANLAASPSQQRRIMELARVVE